MSDRTLQATLTQTHDGRPLAVVDGLPGEGADITPAQLRALAEGLLRIADDAEARPMGPRSFRRQRRQYSLDAASRC